MLDVSHNFIGDNGVEYLAEVLTKENKTLVELHLSKCNISDTGGMHIAKIIATHPHIKKINVAHNLITEESALFITTQIKNNNNIIHCDISKNYIT